MKLPLLGLSVGILSVLAGTTHAAESAAAIQLPSVSVQASESPLLDTPAVSVRITRAQLQQQNVTESSDALRYAPNLQVRSRYIGDPNAVISGRTAGTLQSARSLVYADGLLLSNLMTNGWDGAPRWGMVPPELIETIEVQYGPYSALYPGNAMGNTVLIHTRLPDKLTASTRAQFFSQDFDDAYHAGGHYVGHNLAATLGNRQGRWRWLFAVSKLDNHGQPMQYATARAGGDAALAVPVSGAVLDRNPNGSPRLVYGANSIEHTVQTQASLRVGVDLTDNIDAQFTVGWWHNHSEDRTRSLIRDAQGEPVDSGVIRVDGKTWTLSPSGLAPSLGSDTHVLYGAELHGRLDNGWHWNAAASHYDFLRAQSRTASRPAQDGPGSAADKDGSGWDTLDLRSAGAIGTRHMLYVGLHDDRYVLDSRVRQASAWRDHADGPLLNVFAGRTQTRAAYLQDVWSFSPNWALTVGARWEQWRAYGGRLADSTATLDYADRRRSDLSPKAALSWDFAPDWQFRLSHGKAVRYPTVTELFQGTLVANAIVNNNPDLKPERDESTDLTLQRQLIRGRWRVSVFQDRIADSLYTQTDITVTPTVTSVQNVDLVRIRGIEGELALTDVGLTGLDLSASVAFNNARTLRDRRYPLAEGKWFPRIPRLRASVFADYRFATDWDASLGIRRSGRQYGTLDNSDVVDTYGAVSRFTVADARLRWKFMPGWAASIGVDNLTNQQYWVYHPYAGRTWFGEVRWDL